MTQDLAGKLILITGATDGIGKAAGTDLYVTAPSAENDSPIVLAPKNDADCQRWRLVRQTPLV